MTVQTLSIPEKLALSQAAAKSGLLNDYAPAISAKDASKTIATKSWGSAMRR